MFVYGLHRTCDIGTIKELFSKFGDVTKVTNTGKGYGFVAFKTAAQARLVSPLSVMTLLTAYNLLFI